MIISVASGKGGTGKTSLTAAFASISNGSGLCDADVDAADLHLLMDPEIQKSADFMGGQIAAVDFAKCSRCGYCLELCRFGAIDQQFIVDDIDCEGCGVCVDLCPEQAAAIEALAAERAVPVVGKIPFNPQFTASMVQGHTVCEHDRDSDLCRTIMRLWNRILDTI